MNRILTRSFATALVSLGLLVAGSANGFVDGVEATIFNNFDQVLGCSPSPCHRPIVAADVSFPNAPSIVAQGEVVDLTLRITGGPGVTCGFDADTLGGDFSEVQPDPIVRDFFGFDPVLNETRRGLTHSSPRPFDTSVCEFTLRWEAAVLGTARIAANIISANGDFGRGGDGGGFVEIAIEVAPLVYHITPYDLGKGFSIDSGWISTLDTAPDDGLLDISEIVSFRVDYSHPKGQDTLTDANATLSIEGSNANEGNLAISSTQILVLDESPADHLNFLLVEDDTSFARVFWRNNAGVEKVSFDVQFVDIQSPLEDQLEFFLPPGSIEVATVPEPSLLLLQWSSLLTLLWVAHRPEPAIRAPRDRG